MDIRAALLSLIAADDALVRELRESGTLAEGYHPRMEALHQANAEVLRGIIARHGWPGASLAGADGAAAAWRIVQHAIGEPAFMRQCLGLIAEAARSGEAPGWQAAMLEDRIRTLEGRPQVYGTQLEAGEDGMARPCPTKDPEGLAARRQAVGLEPLEVVLHRTGRIARPSDPERFERDREAWLRRVGWRT